MFEAPGLLYVYRIYGMHWCANVVCGPEGTGSALLVRALEPGGGIDAMWPDRPKARALTDLASGPGKLCAALGLSSAHNGVDLLAPDGAVRLGRPTDGASGPGPGAVAGDAVVAGPRVGISKAVTRPWRFALAANPHVSRPRPPGWR